MSARACTASVLGFAFFLWIVYYAMFVWPETETKRELNERMTVSCLRFCCGAQRMYRRTDWDGDGALEYAFPYTLLYTTASAGQPIRLIDDGVANASRDNPPNGKTTPVYGYVFVDLTGDADGSYDDGESNFVRGHGLCACPAQYGRDSRMTFVVDGAKYYWDRVVYRKDTKGEPVVAFPDVETEGWEPVE